MIELANELKIYRQRLNSDYNVITFNNKNKIERSSYKMTKRKFLC